jgi:hypothetical protein
LKDFSLNKFQKLVISIFPQVFKTQNFIQFQLISSEWCELYPKNTRIELINTKKFTPLVKLFFVTYIFLDDRLPNLFLIPFEQTSVIRKQPERKTAKLIFSFWLFFYKLNLQ